MFKNNTQDRTQNNGFKIEKIALKKKWEKNWFSNRVVDEWNRLAKQILSAKSIRSCKTRLD